MGTRHTQPLSRIVPLSIALIAGLFFSPARAEDSDIGKTAAVKKTVTGKRAEDERKLKKGDSVFQNEVIETKKNSEGEFILKDDTKLAVGPESRLVLDRFVYDPKKKGGDIVITATKGAFRFISGKSGSSAYSIKTPVALIAVRGTIVDGYVNDDGEAAVLLVKGEADVCESGKCKTLKRPGHFIHVKRGYLSDPLKWDGSFLKGLSIGTAFPFVGRKLIIDPVRRLKHSALYGGKMIGKGARQTRKVIRRGTKSIRRSIGKFRPRF